MTEPWKMEDFASLRHVKHTASEYPIWSSAAEWNINREEANRTENTNFEKSINDIEKNTELSIQRRGEIMQNASKIRLKHNKTVSYHEKVTGVIDSRVEELNVIKKRFAREKAAFGAECSEKLHKLFDAVMCNDRKTVAVLLADDDNDEVNGVGSFNQGRTLLMEACTLENLDMIELLLDLGADPNQCDTTGNSCLHVTMRSDILALLLQHHADLGMQDGDGNTILHLALKRKLTLVVLQILACGDLLLLDVQNHQNETPLDVAKDKRHESYKLAVNWKKCFRANELDKFATEWARYLNAPEINPHLAVHPSAKKLLEQFEFQMWQKDADLVFREKVDAYQKETEHIRRFMTSTSKAASGEGARGSDVKMNLTEVVGMARAQYTRAFRADLANKRSHMKPSAREMTLVEYLVGKRHHKRDEQHLKNDKEGESANITISKRRTATAQALLKDNFKGKPRVIYDALSNDEVSLTKPSTRTALGHAGYSARPQLLQRIADKSVHSNKFDNTLHATAQFYATRKTTVPDTYVEPELPDASLVKPNRSLKLDPKVMPPTYDRHQLYSTVKLTKGCPDKFDNIAIAEAVRTAHAQAIGSEFPQSLADALYARLQYTSLDGRDKIELDELRKEFAEFVHNKTPIDTNPAFELIERCLFVQHSGDTLHASLNPYIDYSGYQAQRSNKWSFK